mmetsp:Transcript_31998/g.66788  ORF Transcript_31998/g.66788 Transcript_31998/m.66788 type:complete len:243 (+) Transcript_31998:518-1246(+)
MIHKGGYIRGHIPRTRLVRTGFLLDKFEQSSKTFRLIQINFARPTFAWQSWRLDGMHGVGIPEPNIPQPDMCGTSLRLLQVLCRTKRDLGLCKDILDHGLIELPQSGLGRSMFGNVASIMFHEIDLLLLGCEFEITISSDQATIRGIVPRTLRMMPLWMTGRGWQVLTVRNVLKQVCHHAPVSQQTRKGGYQLFGDNNHSSVILLLILLRLRQSFLRTGQETGQDLIHDIAPSSGPWSVHAG